MVSLSVFTAELTSSSELETSTGYIVTFDRVLVSNGFSRTSRRTLGLAFRPRSSLEACLEDDSLRFGGGNASFGSNESLGLLYSEPMMVSACV